MGPYLTAVLRAGWGKKGLGCTWQPPLVDGENDGASEAATGLLYVREMLPAAQLLTRVRVEVGGGVEAVGGEGKERR